MRIKTIFLISIFLACTNIHSADARKSYDCGANQVDYTWTHTPDSNEFLYQTQSVYDEAYTDYRANMSFNADVDSGLIWECNNNDGFCPVGTTIISTTKMLIGNKKQTDQDVIFLCKCNDGCWWDALKLSDCNKLSNDDYFEDYEPISPTITSHETSHTYYKHKNKNAFCYKEGGDDEEDDGDDGDEDNDGDGEEDDTTPVDPYDALIKKITAKIKEINEKCNLR